MKIKSLSTSKILELKSPIHEVEKKLRLLRAGKFLALGVGLAAATIPLVGIHLVTIPSFLGFGIFSFFQKLKETKWVLIENEHCPECGAILNKQMIYFNEDTVKIRCSACRSQLRILE